MFWIEFYYRLLQLKAISLVVYYLQFVYEDSPYCKEQIIIILILSLIWYVKLVKPTSIFTVVFFTTKINDQWSMITNPCCFSQAVLHNCLNSSLVMSLSHDPGKCGYGSAGLGQTDIWNSRCLYLFDAAAWNNFELNRNNQRWCVFLWYNKIHRYFVFQVTDHQIPLDSFS